MGTAASVKDKLGDEPPMPTSSQPPPPSPSKRRKDEKKSDKERRSSAASSASGGSSGGGRGGDGGGSSGGGDGGRRRDERRASRSVAIDNARKKRPSKDKLPGNGGGGAETPQRHHSNRGGQRGDGADNEPFTPEGGGSFNRDRPSRGHRPSQSGPPSHRPDRGATKKPAPPAGKPLDIVMRTNYSSDEDGSVDSDTMQQQATSTLKGEDKERMDTHTLDGLQSRNFPSHSHALWSPIPLLPIVISMSDGYQRPRSLPDAALVTTCILAGNPSPMSDASSSSPTHARPQPSPGRLRGDNSRGSDFHAMRNPGRERPSGPVGSPMAASSPSR